MSLPPLTLNAWLRYDLIRRALDAMGEVSSILEIGAGEGAMGARMASRYTYVGVEPDDVSRQRAKERLDRLGREASLYDDLSAVDLDTRFDVVCAFEVIEHIEDDVGALRQWRARLRSRGWLLLSVPLHAARYGAGDRQVGHHRRYERPEMARLLASAGCEDIRLWTYGFPLGYVLDWLRNMVAARSQIQGSMGERSAASGRHLQPLDTLGWATWLMSAPFRLLERPFVGTEFGTGLVAMARSAE